MTSYIYVELKSDDQCDLAPKSDLLSSTHFPLLTEISEFWASPSKPGLMSLCIHIPLMHLSFCATFVPILWAQGECIAQGKFENLVSVLICCSLKLVE